MKLSVYVLGREVAVLESVGDFKSVLTYAPNTATYRYPPTGTFGRDEQLNGSLDSSKALLGMQPMRKHVPPSAFSFSMQAVSRPSCAARIAAT